MSDDIPAVDSFEEAIRAVISRYAEARLLTMAETIGVLHIIAASLIAANLQEDEE